MIYGFFSIQIGHAFFPTDSVYGSLMLSLATFGAGFVTRPIGAIAIGNFADRVGRRPAMMLCFMTRAFALRQLNREEEAQHALDTGLKLLKKKKQPWLTTIGLLLATATG